MARTKQTARRKEAPKKKKYKIPVQGLKEIAKAQKSVEPCISKAAMAR